MLGPSPAKSSITLEDLLTMRSGLDFIEGDQSTFSTPDPARAMFEREVVDCPDTSSVPPGNARISL
jgi:CubicO group peptidase (beta-lactamase class C family)